MILVSEGNSMLINVRANKYIGKATKDRWIGRLGIKSSMIGSRCGYIRQEDLARSFSLPWTASDNASIDRSIDR